MHAGKDGLTRAVRASGLCRPSPPLCSHSCCAGQGTKGLSNPCGRGPACARAPCAWCETLLCADDDPARSSAESHVPRARPVSGGVSVCARACLTATPGSTPPTSAWARLHLAATPPWHRRLPRLLVQAAATRRRRGRAVTTRRERLAVLAARLLGVRSGGAGL